MGRETVDRLLGGRVALRQPASGFRVSVDAVLLASTVPLAPGQRALDVGCGAGGATLCLASRLPHARLCGIDRDAALIDFLRANVADNGFADRVAAETLDLADGVPDGLRGGFDHVLSNPPYLPPHRADVRSIADNVAAATIESVPFADWLAFMAACCLPKGHVSVIHRADRLEEILAAFADLAGALRVLPIRPRAGDAAKRIIVTGRVGVHAPTILLPGLTLHGADGGYSEAARAIIEDAAPLELDAAFG